MRFTWITQALPPILLLWATAAPADPMDVSGFDAVLRTHVKDGVVNYPAIAADERFSAFIDALARPAVLSNKQDKLVYYMNAYNALAMKGIIDGLSPSSFFGRQHYFKLASYRLNGQEVNLDALEHTIIRSLGEPRIHFSIVCASRSCPKQRSDAYTNATLEMQLDENAREFINDTSRNRFDKQAQIAHLSEVFKWFAEDFVKSAGSVPKFIARYAADADVARDLANDGYQIKYNSYDWNLNGLPPRKK
jgi:hypothetical protein